MACTEERRGAYSVVVRMPEGKKTTWKEGVYGCIILKWIFKKRDGEA